MGAVIQVWRNITRSLNGGTRSYGNLVAPFSEYDTGTTDGPAIDDSVIIAAGDTAVLWEYGVNSVDWSFGLVEIAGASTGVIYLATMSDTPTSSTVLTASGAAVTWNNEVLTGKVSREWGGRASRTNATPANHAKASGVHPNAWVAGQGEVDGYIYKIEAKNPGSTTLRVRRIFLG